MQRREAEERLLDTAEALFYERGVQAVGMAEVRTASGVSLKRLYQCFESKDRLVEAYLRRRDERWRASLDRYVTTHPDSGVLAVFDWLHEWFAEPGFHGCAFINSFGELGATSPAVARAAGDHKDALRAYLLGLLNTPDQEELADQLLMLIDGAITGAAIGGSPRTALAARSAAQALVSAAGRNEPTSCQV